MDIVMVLFVNGLNFRIQGMDYGVKETRTQDALLM